jgi:hypothetical protein
MALSSVSTVRRLTPRECERLMSWPDDWTSEGIDDNGRLVSMADGPRYRMCGNGVGRVIAAWIGRRIAAANVETTARAEVNTRFCRSACPLYDDRVEGCPQVGKASGETHKCASTTETLKRHHALREG